MKSKALIPIEQDLVPFHDHKIFGVRLLDGLIAASIGSLCRMLKLSQRGQVQRILRDEVLSKHLLLVIVDTPGGPQTIQVLTAQAIPTWLTGIQSSMVAPEKRPLILALKEEAVEVLYRHFFHIDPESAPPQQERPTRSADSPAQMIAEAAQMIGEAAHLIAAEQQTLKERVTTLEERHEITEERQQAMGEHLVEARERQRGIEERQQAMGQQQEVVEEQLRAMGDYLVETRERVTALEQQQRSTPHNSEGDAPPSDGPILSPQQLAQVYTLAREARRRSGMPVSAQLAALAEALGVPDVSDLPESAWDKVLDWFWQQRHN